MSKDWKSLFQKFGMVEKYLLVGVILGSGVIGVSLFRGIVQNRSVEVEILKSETKVSSIFVDVAGAVIKPDVYELPNGSRLKDVLVLAGGYSEEADREYCEKVFNLAEVLKDGQKFFVPSKNDTPAKAGYNEANFEGKLVNLNTATMSELDTLWGIGKVKAESIVKNRPYQSLNELVVKKVLTKTILENNEGRLSVY